MKTESQNKAILKYLKKGNPITVPVAEALCGSKRLASRIYDLKKLGYDIEPKMIKLRNGKRVAEYRLVA